ncbi:hypothetical protein [Roseibium sediminis]|uniref:hypothetical protein n=1 Tax=Roseibium sediminis TaxID=1775174 RepID=UPI00123DB62F|nr:hypothetical protein [Roseibium sediminis]
MTKVLGTLARYATSFRAKLRTGAGLLHVTWSEGPASWCSARLVYLVDRGEELRSGSVSAAIFSAEIRPFASL